MKTQNLESTPRQHWQSGKVEMQSQFTWIGWTAGEKCCMSAAWNTNTVN